MDLNTYLNTKEPLIDFAKRIAVPFPSLSNWRYGKRPVPIGRCIDIEKATGGLVTRKDLRPDDWQKIWPELAEQEHKKSDEAA